MHLKEKDEHLFPKFDSLIKHSSRSPLKAAFLLGFGRQSRHCGVVVKGGDWAGSEGNRRLGVEFVKHFG